MTSRPSTGGPAARTSAPPTRKKWGPTLAIAALVLTVAVGLTYLQADEHATALCWSGRSADTVPARRAALADANFWARVTKLFQRSGADECNILRNELDDLERLGKCPQHPPTGTACACGTQRWPADRSGKGIKCVEQYDSVTRKARLVLDPPQEDGSGSDPAFWRWVQGNVEELKHIKTGKEPVADQLLEELHRVSPGLVFEIGTATDPIEIRISADGDRALFPAVQRLVAAAPAIAGLKVIGFRPRQGGSEPLRISVGSTELDADEMWFTARRDASPRPIALTVYIRGLTEKNKAELGKAAFLLLDTLLGEYDVETKIGAIDFQRASRKPDATMKPLRELPAVVDARK